MLHRWGISPSQDVGRTDGDSTSADRYSRTEFERVPPESVSAEQFYLMGKLSFPLTHFTI
jgi:hypothetical protein